MREAVAVACLAACLVAAVLRRRRVPEVAVAVPAALLLLAIGGVTGSAARVAVSRLGPVVGFLVAVLVLAAACERDGLFAAVGASIARRSGGSARRLFVLVAVAAAVTTAVLSLDTTAVLLTPVVLVAARRAGVPPRPSLYVAGHLANTGSLLLPVSNLTNLLALAVVPVSFLRFGALMALPWLAAVAVDTGLLTVLFGPDLRGRPAARAGRPSEDWPFPRLAASVVGATLAGFVVASLAGVAVAWPAAAGAAVLVAHQGARRTATARAVIVSADLPFAVFVLALGVVVAAVSAGGLGAVVRHLVPHGDSLPALLGVAAASALIANVVNNLPATLLLLPVAAAGGVGPVLAVLIGVDVGPTLTYPGSLATLLWRRNLADVGDGGIRRFTGVAVVTVPVTLVAATVALWLSLRWFGT